MKKILSFVLITALLAVAMALPVFAASASLSGPDVVRAGDTIKVSFRAGGDDVKGGSGKLSFDASQLTLTGFSSGMSGEWNAEYDEGQKTFFFYHDKGSSGPALGSSRTIITATFQVSDSLTPGTSISVSASYSLSDGSKDIASSSDSYSVTIAEPLSNNALLKSLTVSNAAISPAFSPNVTSYRASVPYDISTLKVAAEAEHPGAKVSVSNTALAANSTTYVKVTVTAEDGTTKTYTISTWRAKDPNYVESNVNTLKELSVEGFLLSPVFSADKDQYAVYVPYETETVTFAGATSHTLAKAQFPEKVAVPVGESVHEIVVTAENGETRSYFVTVYRAEEFGVEVTEPTEPETVPTEPETVPTEITEPTELPEPEDPQIPEPELKLPWWYLPIAAVVGFALGAALLLVKKKKN